MDRAYRLFRVAGRFAAVYFSLVVIFLLALTASSLIPSSLLEQNIGRTIVTLTREGIYPHYGLPWRQITLDNFTDTLMVNTAYSVDSGNPLRAALVNVRHSSKAADANQISSLERFYLHQETQEVGYERYWHGYLIFLRPLLTIFPYSGIRWVITSSLWLLFLSFVYLSWKRLGKKAAVSFIAGFLMVDFLDLGQSMQFSSVFFVGLSGSLYLLLTHKKRRHRYILFFVVGGLTSFFDLLTAPLVTLGMLLIIVAHSEDENIKSIFLYCLSWSTGYLLLWYGKWSLVEAFFVPHARAVALNEVVRRTVSQADTNFSHFNAVYRNLLQLIGNGHINKIVILSFLGVLLLFVLRYLSFKAEKGRRMISLIFIGAIPYVWYFVVANHSYIHYWYTYRDQLMSVVCFLLAAAYLIDWQRLNRDIFSLRRKLLEKTAVEYHSD